MHFMFLVEDASGGILLENVLPRILNGNVTFEIHKYKGIGRIPKNLSARNHPNQKTILGNLPRLISGIGKTFNSYPNPESYHLFVIVDSDDNDPTQLNAELNSLLGTIQSPPQTYFCLAIEEGEAWLLGDQNAVKAAYPNAKSNILAGYSFDSICGTWELLANAIHSGGAVALAKQPYFEIGKAKCEWAAKIGLQMDPKNNKSPSFKHFHDRVTALVR